MFPRNCEISMLQIPPNIIYNEDGLHFCFRYIFQEIHVIKVNCMIENKSGRCRILRVPRTQRSYRNAQDYPERSA